MGSEGAVRGPSVLLPRIAREQQTYSPPQGIYTLYIEALVDPPVSADTGELYACDSRSCEQIYTLYIEALVDPPCPRTWGSYTHVTAAVANRFIRYTLRHWWIPRVRSSWYEKTRRAFCPPARRCGRRSSPAGPGADSPGAARCGSRQSRLGRW